MSKKRRVAGQIPEEVTELEDILAEMDIPRNRTRVNLVNLNWLERNLGDRNEDSIDYDRAMILIYRIIKDKLYPS